LCFLKRVMATATFDPRLCRTYERFPGIEMFWLGSLPDIVEIGQLL